MNRMRSTLANRLARQAQARADGTLRVCRPRRSSIPPDGFALRPAPSTGGAHAARLAGLDGTRNGKPRPHPARDGLDHAAPGAPPIARDGASIPPTGCQRLDRPASTRHPRPCASKALPRRASTVRPRPARPPMVCGGLDRSPGRVRRLDARACTAAAACRAAAGRGGARRRPAPPHVCGRHTLQRQILSIGVDKIG